MISTPAVIDVPLRTDENGVIRIGPSRVTLTTIIGRHQVRDTPEDIHRGFPTVPLAVIYSVIAYYLPHTQEVDEYIAEVERQGEKIRQKLEAMPNYKPLPTEEELLKRLDDKKRTQGAISLL